MLDSIIILITMAVISFMLIFVLILVALALNFACSNKKL